MIRIMKVEDLKNTKIYLSNKEDVIKFLEKVFKLGVLWMYGAPQYIKGEPFYYINSNFQLTKDTIYQNEYFKKHKYEQIFLHDVLSIEEPEAKYEFKPFDRVLVRYSDKDIWIPRFYSHRHRISKDYPFEVTSGGAYRQCIPYEGNEHLVGTTNSK